MKKRFLLLAGILAMSFAVAGCGCGKKNEEVVPNDTPVTVAPVQEDTSTSGKNLVDMQVSTKAEITNILGEKTSTAAELVLINKTGAEVSAIYIRPNTDDDYDWGSELIKGTFVLKDGDKALYYFEKGTASLYDIRITYSDSSRNECFFRKIPLNNISEIALRMDGVGEASIPYATYTSGTSKKEVSTLNEVKQRLGLIGNSNDYEDEEDDENTAEVTPTPTPQVTPTPVPQVTPTTAPVLDGPVDDGSDDDAADPLVSAAEGCIGQSLSTLIGAVGEPVGSDYENEPESGETGYHYYTTENGSFTVSTIVDENGNEIVAGVW